MLTLRDAGVRYVARNMPRANDLTVGFLALVVEEESEAISKRAKEALASMKVRGVKLGTPNSGAALRRSYENGRSRGITATADSDSCAQGSAPILAAICTVGHTAFFAIAADLDARGIQTRRGSRWLMSNERNLLEPDGGV